MWGKDKRREEIYCKNAQVLLAETGWGKAVFIGCKMNIVMVGRRKPVCLMREDLDNGKSVYKIEIE